MNVPKVNIVFFINRKLGLSHPFYYLVFGVEVIEDQPKPVCNDNQNDEQALLSYHHLFPGFDMLDWGGCTYFNPYPRICSPCNFFLF